MNKVILCGRLTRDPEIRYSQGNEQMAIAHYGIAVDRARRKEGETQADFFNCVSFGRSAEFAEKYMHKGERFLIEGRIQNDSYVNRDGQRVNTTQIIVDSQEFADGKSNAQPAQQTAPQPMPQQQVTQQPMPQQQMPQQRPMIQQPAPQYNPQSYNAQNMANDGFMQVTPGEDYLPFQ